MEHLYLLKKLVISFEVVVRTLRGCTDFSERAVLYSKLPQNVLLALAFRAARSLRIFSQITTNTSEKTELFLNSKITKIKRKI